MSGDYSRKRFDSTKHYSGVLQQQGRVALDADWNEYVDIQDHRWRAETLDVVGRCGVPKETPDGFKVGFSKGGSSLTIGTGRIYVDGLLVENHGQAPRDQFDPILEERYNTKPFSPDVLGSINADGKYLVYLDVWRREVTHLQDPNLVEPALGVDTTTRYETAWRIRILGVDEKVTCANASAALEDEHKPSAARLTTSTVKDKKQAELCEIQSSGEYRRSENQLYRVEVHKVDKGTTFVKWSRDNATVTSRVVEIPSKTSIRVDSLGRDDVLCFKTGYWVEITSDIREMSGRPGLMRQVTIEEKTKTLSFSGDLPVEDFPTDGNNVPSADANIRVIRWDQTGQLSDGLIELKKGKSTELDSDVQITLDLTCNGNANVGDYWCFAARTAEASIEELNKAPPMGIHHHFCALATFKVKDKVFSENVDCRPVFNPITDQKTHSIGGCCAFVVEPGSNIQAALNSLPSEGGCVCLKAGEHRVQRTIQITKSNVLLCGESLGARIVADDIPLALGIYTHPYHQKSKPLENISISNIHFQTNGNNSLVMANNSYNFSIKDCRFEASKVDDILPTFSNAIILNNGIRSRIQGNIIINAFFGIISNQGIGNTIKENEIRYGVGAVSFINETELEFIRNIIFNMAAWGLGSVNGVRRHTIIGNRFVSCGFLPGQQDDSPFYQFNNLPRDMSIGVLIHTGELHIESNEIVDTGISWDRNSKNSPTWGIKAEFVLECRIQSNLITYSQENVMPDFETESRAVLIRGLLEEISNAGSTGSHHGYSAQILDNKFIGMGQQNLIEIDECEIIENRLWNRFERVIFSNNYCEHNDTQPGKDSATLSVKAGSAIVQGNHFKTSFYNYSVTGGLPSVNFHSTNGIYIGNFAMGGPVDDTDLPESFDDLNKV